jgi:hypothetical protein
VFESRWSPSFFALLANMALRPLRGAGDAADDMQGRRGCLFLVAQMTSALDRGKTDGDTQCQGTERAKLVD